MIFCVFSFLQETKKTSIAQLASNMRVVFSLEVKIKLRVPKTNGQIFLTIL